MTEFFTLFSYLLLGSLVALVGGLAFLFIKPWSKFLTKYSVPFASGVLLTVALVGLLPEAVHVVGEKAFLVTLLAFLGAYLFEQSVCDLHHHDTDHDCSHRPQTSKGSVFLVIVGDTIHNFIDGVAIAAAYLANPGLGLITTVSTFLHEVPHEIGDFGILLKAGWKRGRVLLVNIFSALFTIVGGLTIFFLMPNQTVIGYLLAIAAGMFLYLGASDFLPHAARDLGRGKTIAALGLGVILMFATLRVVPHSHDLEDGHDHGHEAEMEHDHEDEHMEIHDEEFDEDDHVEMEHLEEHEDEDMEMHEEESHVEMEMHN